MSNLENDDELNELQDLDDSTSEEEMGVIDHLSDLRATIIRCILSLVFGCAVVMTFLKYFASILNWPLKYALGEEATHGLITTGPMSVFSVILQVSFLGGVSLSLPFILYFVARFIMPGLNKKELDLLKPGCILAFILFMVGLIFSYFTLVPASLKASLFFNELFGFQVYWSAERYYGLLLWMTVGVGLSFEFPLIVLILVYIGIVNVEQLKTFRPYSIGVFLIVAAVITPTTDPFTFLLLAVPMSILYEVALLLAKRISKKIV